MFRRHTYRVINAERIINSVAVTIVLADLKVRIKAVNLQPFSCSIGNLKISLSATCMHIKLKAHVKRSVVECNCRICTHFNKVENIYTNEDY